MNKKNKLAIFASGSGSNAERIVEHFAHHELIEVVIILSNNKNAYVHERAKKLSIPSCSFSRQDFYDTDRVLEILQEREIDTVILAGFLWLVPHKLIQAYPNSMINIHPALLPKYGGKGMYGHHVHEAVVRNKEIETGITIHLVNEEYDKGEVLFQAKCTVSETDTSADVAKKIHELEYLHFPDVIENYVLKLLTSD